MVTRHLLLCAELIPQSKKKCQQKHNFEEMCSQIKKIMSALPYLLHQYPLRFQTAIEPLIDEFEKKERNLLYGNKDVPANSLGIINSGVGKSAARPFEKHMQGQHDQSSHGNEDGHEEIPDTTIGKIRVPGERRKHWRERHPEVSIEDEDRIIGRAIHYPEHVVASRHDVHATVNYSKDDDGKLWAVIIARPPKSSPFILTVRRARPAELDE